MGSWRLAKTALCGANLFIVAPVLLCIFLHLGVRCRLVILNPLCLRKLTSMQQEKLGTGLHRAYQSHLHLPDTDPKANHGAALLEERSSPA